MSKVINYVIIILRMQKNFIFGIMLVRELNIICLYHFINKCNYHEVRNEECEEIEGKSVNEHLAQREGSCEVTN